MAIASTKEEHATKPLTLFTEDSVLEKVAPGEGGVDMFARRGFTSLLSASGDASKNMSTGYFHISSYPKSGAEDMRKRGYRFLTVPAAASPSGHGQEGTRVATVTHELDWDRLFRYEETRTKDDLVPGEAFEIAMVKGCLGTRWWCWGDLDSDLKGKKLHIWHTHEGYYGEDKPQKDDGWVLGEDPMHLDWKDITEGGKVKFTIVE